MSMLAEPRQKKRYTLVPKGKPLYDDTNRFGTKMLEKMGWSKGKGLGAGENGMQDFVRIKFKGDAAGFGYQDRDDQWTEHDKKFNALLNSLNNSPDSESKEISDDIEPERVGFGFQEPKKEEIVKIISGESLEQKSKKSKARVHYKKFTRSKDLSQYSEKDLANIFGKKELNVVNVVKLEEPVQETQNNVVTTGLTVTEYFKEKMEKMKNKKKNNDEENSAINIMEISENLDENATVKSEINKKKKKKASKHENIESINYDTKKINVEEVKKIKKNKQKYNENSEIQIDVENSNEIFKPKNKKNKNHKEDSLETPSKKRKYKNEEIVENTEICLEPSKKKSKKSKNKELTKISPEVSSSNESESAKTMKKSKKKKNFKTEKSEHLLNPPTEPQYSFELDSVNSKKKKLQIIKNETDEEETLQITKQKCDNLEKSNNSIVINEYIAEKFRQTNLEAFHGSNISDILGYDVKHPLNICIKRAAADENKIIQLWSKSTLLQEETVNDKYNSPYFKYRQKVKEARKLKKKVPAMDVKKFQNKSLFLVKV